MKQKVVFFGSSRYVLPIIQVLKSTESRFNLELVVTSKQNPTDAVPSYCIKNKIPYISISNLSDPMVNSKLLSVNCEFAVLADFGLIVPPQILNIFPKGIINLHPSLLPRHRGSTPVQTAILNGDKKTGISIILLDEKMDHGPILFQKEENLSKNDTSEDVYIKMFKIGSEYLIQAIKQYTKNNTLIPQDDSKATFTSLLKKDDGLIDIESPPPAERIKTMIRAYFPWPGVWTKWKMENARPAKLGRSGGKWKILKLLPNEKIQVEGKRPMSYKDFMNGYSQGKEILKKLGLN